MKEGKKSGTSDQFTVTLQTVNDIIGVDISLLLFHVFVQFLTINVSQKLQYMQNNTSIHLVI